MIHGVELIRVPVPRQKERETRDFYGVTLGFRELNRSAGPSGEAGIWFALPDGRELFCCALEEFRPSRRAVSAFAVKDLELLADTLGRAGYRAVWDFAVPEPYFHCQDPFANRLEFVTEERYG
jgi:catechol 2,3-dioxygenase-like lactoylglutathione lyase family enzyme